MSTTADKLNYLLDTKNAIKEAIIAKGATIEESDTFRSYADIISNIAGGGFPTSVNWTEPDLPVDRTPLMYDYMHISSSSIGKIYTSDDGLTWSMKDTGIYDFELIHIANGVWHGKSKTRGLLYSTDCGITWAQTDMPISSNYTMRSMHNIWYCLYFDNSNTAQQYYSLNGKNWTSMIGNIGVIRYANGIYIMHSNGNSKMWISTDGTSFDVIEQFDTSASSQYIFWYKGRWIVEQGGISYYSDDNGKTWNETTHMYMRRMETDGNVIIGHSKQDGNIYRSTDGVTWELCQTTELTSGSYSLNIQCYHGIWYIYGTNNEFYVSVDSGIHWHRLNIPDNYTVVSGVYCDGRSLFIRCRMSDYTYKSFYTLLF